LLLDVVSDGIPYNLLQILVPGHSTSVTGGQPQSTPGKNDTHESEQVPWLEAALDAKLLITYVMEEQWIELNVHGLHMGLILKSPSHHSLPTYGERHSKKKEVLLEPCDLEARYSRYDTLWTLP